MGDYVRYNQIEVTNELIEQNIEEIQELNTTINNSTNLIAFIIIIAILYSFARKVLGCKND